MSDAGTPSAAPRTPSAALRAPHVQRDNPFKPVWGLLAILLVLVVVQGLRSYFRPDEIIPWRTDYAAAVQEAKQSNKPLLLYFTAKWCGPCQEMRHTTWADKDVDAALRSYVPAKIDFDANVPLAMKYNAEALPRMIVVNPEDERVLRWIDGLVSPEEFVRWLDRKPISGP